MIILIKLLLAHLLADFVFQSNKWVVAKERNKLSAWQLYVHVGLHGVLSMLFVFERAFWWCALIILVSHFIIDTLKLYAQKHNNKRYWFFGDQIAHMLVLIVVWYFYTQPVGYAAYFYFPQILCVGTFGLLLTTPLAIGIKLFISKWNPDNAALPLLSAGKYIGIFERILVFLFVLINHWEAIGFLIAAKSVFRFGDLREAKDRQLTEYMLIGTFLSFGSAMLIGLLCSYLLPII